MKRGVSVRATLAGQVDAGFASLASFACAVFAARVLPPAVLGAYALLFTAFVAIAQVSTQLVFTPSEVDSVRQPQELRLGMCATSVPRGAGISVLAACLVPLGVLPVWSHITTPQLIGLAVTATLATALSPIQDHLRRAFHIGGRSWVSARMSIFQFVVTVAALLLITQMLGPEWAPFGALAVANAFTTALGIWQLPRKLVGFVAPAFRTVLASGRWLLTAGLGEPLLAYGALTIVSLLAGPDTLGFAEGARVVAQPLNVVAFGLSAVFGPRAIEAADRGDEGEAKRLRRRVLLLVAIVGGPYFAIAAFPWAGNPMVGLVPSAFEVPYLVVVAFAASFATTLLIPLHAELLGWGQEKAVARYALSDGVVQVATATSARLLGSYTVPIGWTVGAATFVVLAHRRLMRLYTRAGRGARESGTSSETPED